MYSLIKDYNEYLINDYDFGSTGVLIDKINGVNGTNYGTVNGDDNGRRFRTFNGSSYIQMSKPLIKYDKYSIITTFRITKETSSLITLLTNVYNGPGNYPNLTVYFTNERKISLYLYDYSTYSLMSTRQLDIGKWYQLIIVYDGINVKMYINDLENGKDDYCEKTLTINNAYSYGFRLGMYVAMSGYYRYLTGDISELKIYSDPIELTNKSYVCKSQNYFYSIKDEYYNTDVKKYNEISKPESRSAFIEKGFFNVSDMYNNKTINDETFKPATKFDPYSIIKCK